jgi:hypothetical protein
LLLIVFLENLLGVLFVARAAPVAALATSAKHHPDEGSNVRRDYVDEHSETDGGADNSVPVD